MGRLILAEPIDGPGLGVVRTSIADLLRHSKNSSGAGNTGKGAIAYPIRNGRL